MKWNGINHISDFCGSIWVFFGCAETLHALPASCGGKRQQEEQEHCRSTVPARLAESSGGNSSGDPKSEMGAFGALAGNLSPSEPFPGGLSGCASSHRGVVFSHCHPKEWETILCSALQSSTAMSCLDLFQYFSKICQMRESLKSANLINRKAGLEGRVYLKTDEIIWKKRMAGTMNAKCHS